MKSTFLTIIAVFGAVAVLSPDLAAQPLSGFPSCLSIKLQLDKQVYSFGDDIQGEISITNNCNRNIWISKGFSSRDYALDIRLIDPLQRILRVTRGEPHQEFPDAPPLAFLPDPSNPRKTLRVVPCELLAPNWTRPVPIKDLKSRYPMPLPGPYSAQVQISVMIFESALEKGKDCQCDVNHYEWLGVLKSPTKHLLTEGTTEIKIPDSKWRLKWKGNPDPAVPGKENSILVEIIPGPDQTVDDFRLNTIRLNKVKLNGVQKSSGALRASFDKKLAVESLGPVESGNVYPVVVWGTLQNGEIFAGSHNVEVID